MKIISIVANNPIFIELQYKTLKKFVDFEFEYIIFNDGKNWPDITNFGDINEGKDGIIKKCNELNIQCINIPNDQHRTIQDASRRHTDSLIFVSNFMRQNNDEYLMLDSDMFLVDKFDISIYQKYNCACVLQERPNLTYIWPNFFYINMKKIKNKNLFDLAMVSGGDTGSATDRWLKSFNYEYPSTKLIRNSIVQFENPDFYFIKHLWSCSWNKREFPVNLNEKLLDFLNFDRRNKNDNFFCEIYDNKILHYRAGTNWMNEKKDLHNQNIRKLEEIINSIIL